MKKLLFLIICFVLCSGIAAILIYSQNKNPSSEITKNKDVEHAKREKENEADQKEELKKLKQQEKKEEGIINGSDYFFKKTSCQAIQTILLVIGVGISFFFWNRKNIKPEDESSSKPHMNSVEKKIFVLRLSLKALFSKDNLYGLTSLIYFFFITLIVEIIINHLLIGSISHFFSKDKNKKYLHTLKMSLKKRISLFSSYFFFILYLIYGFVIALIAKSIPKQVANEHTNA